jgi:hypothetical protein
VNVLIVCGDMALGSESNAQSGTGYATFRATADQWRIKVFTVRSPLRVRGVEQLPPARRSVIVAPLYGLLDANAEAVRLVVKEERLSAAGGRQPGSASTAHDLAGLHAVVEQGVWRRGVPYLDVAGPKIKKYATGRGNAPKEDVRLAAAKRLDQLAECANGNESDALWLLVMTLAHYGLTLVQLPVVHQLALDAIDWPAVPGLDLKGLDPHGWQGQHLSAVPQG